MKLYDEGRCTSRLKEEVYSFLDIGDISGTRSDHGGGVGGVGMVGKRVEVVARSGRVVYGKSYCT